MHEVQEWQKSQKELETELQDNPHGGYVGARASKRLMTQCFARGVCRGAVECVNLVDHLEHSDPTAAEAIKTGQVAEMSLHFGLQLLRAATRGEPLPPDREKIQTDTIATNVNKKPIARPQLWTLYGNRGKDPRVEHLSAYEFVRYYHDKESRYPWTLKKHQEQRRQEAAAAVAEGSSSTPSSARTQSLKFHARLTDSGRQKLENKVSRTRLPAKTTGSERRAGRIGCPSEPEASCRPIGTTGSSPPARGRASPCSSARWAAATRRRTS